MIGGTDEGQAVGASPVAIAYNTLVTALKADPDYARAWQCNITMPIFDYFQGRVTIREANEVADILMRHLFSVQTVIAPGVVDKVP